MTTVINIQVSEETIRKIAAHNLRDRIVRVQGDNGNEAHRILPEIWPIINELLKITDACEEESK